MTVADLAARDLGSIVTTNGFRGRLRRIEQAAAALDEDPRHPSSKEA